MVEILYSKDDIAEAVKRVAIEITRDYKEKDKNPIFIGVLKGSFIFLADLIREVNLDCETDFIIAKSYGQNTVSSGCVQIVKDIDVEIEGRDVIIVEDILETANTLSSVCEILQRRNPSSIAVCVLLDKKAKRKIPFEADYICFDIEDGFVIGYGLDYAEKYRNLPFIGIIQN